LPLKDWPKGLDLLIRAKGVFAFRVVILPFHETRKGDSRNSELKELEKGELGRLKVPFQKEVPEKAFSKICQGHFG